jgi:Zn-dependent protease with chaperone function
MSGLLPLLFALAILDTSRPGEALALEPLPWWRWAVVFAGTLTAWASLSEAAGRLLSHARDPRWIERWDLVAQGLMLAWLGWICYSLGWTARIDTYTAAILPWLGAQVVHTWCLAGGFHPGAERRRSRRGLLLHHFRFGMASMVLLLLPVFDVCNYLSIKTGVQGWFMAHIGQHITEAIGSVLLGLVALALMPAALVRLWRARSLPAGGMRDALLAACARMHVGVHDLMLWPSDGARVYNGVMIGVVPRVRYVVFTEDLLTELPPRQVLAVLGHELGHARRKHLLLYLLFGVATLLASYLLAPPVMRLLALIPDETRLSVEVQKGLATLLLLALKWRLIFGYLSRACERQADLDGAALCGDPTEMQAALRSVAQLSGQSEHTPSWRHYSIAQRVEFLGRVWADPSVGDRHHRLVRAWWCVLAVIVLALAATVAIIAARGGIAPP